MSEMITKNHALVAQFGDTLDRLLDSDIGRRTLPDGQGGVGTAESEPPHLAGLPQQRDDCLLSVGWKDSLQGIGHRKDACRQLPRSIQACRHIMPAVP